MNTLQRKSPATAASVPKSTTRAQRMQPKGGMPQVVMLPPQIIPLELGIRIKYAKEQLDMLNHLTSEPKPTMEFDANTKPEPNIHNQLEQYFNNMKDSQEPIIELKIEQLRIQQEMEARMQPLRQQQYMIQRQFQNLTQEDKIDAENHINTLIQRQKTELNEMLRSARLPTLEEEDKIKETRRRTDEEQRLRKELKRLREIEKNMLKDMQNQKMQQQIEKQKAKQLAQKAKQQAQQAQKAKQPAKEDKQPTQQNKEQTTQVAKVGGFAGFLLVLLEILNNSK